MTPYAAAYGASSGRFDESLKSRITPSGRC